jgi:hypothetical protein
MSSASRADAGAVTALTVGHLLPVLFAVWRAGSFLVGN